MTLDSSDDEEWFDPMDSWEGDVLEASNTGKPWCRLGTAELHVQST